MGDVLTFLPAGTLQFSAISLLMIVGTLLFFFVNMALEVSGREPAGVRTEAKLWVKRHKALFAVCSLFAVLGIFLAWNSLLLEPSVGRSASTDPPQLFYGVSTSDLHNMGVILGLSFIPFAFLFLLLPAGIKGAQVFGVLVNSAARTSGVLQRTGAIKKFVIVSLIVLISSLSGPTVWHVSKIDGDKSAVTTDVNNINDSEHRDAEPKAKTQEELFYGFTKNDLLRGAELIVLCVLSYWFALVIIRPIVEAFIVEASNTELTKEQRRATTLLVLPATIAALLIAIALHPPG